VVRPVVHECNSHNPEETPRHRPKQPCLICGVSPARVIHPPKRCQR
jgi:hypothetical protein